MDAEKKGSDDAATATAGADSSRAWCSACLPVAVLVFLLYPFAQTARRVRDDPYDLAFVVAAYFLLASLFLCLRRVEQLTTASPPGERRRLQRAVWALSAVLSCAFAYRVCEIMPAALTVVVWCVTASVIGVGFYGLVVYADDRGSEDCCGVSDAEKSFHKIDADEMV